MAQETIIHALELFDGKNHLKNKFIHIAGDSIIDITNKKSKADYEGIVTPAFIDAHSHIGMTREGEPYQEDEGNDQMAQIQPLLNPLNSVYFDDRAFRDSVDFGVLYSCIVPGSGNLIAGKAMIIRNFASHRDQALVSDYGFKMALGYNPRSTTEWKGDRPNTRMGIYAMLEKQFDSLLIKEEIEKIKLESKTNALTEKLQNQKITQASYDKSLHDTHRENYLAFTPEEHELLKLLHGEKIAKVHVHKEDDVLYLIHLVEKYGLNVTADHLGDVFNTEIFNKLAKHNIPIVYGPLGSLGYKVELKHGYYQNTKLLMKSKALFGLMTDHPVIYSYNLRDSLKFFLIQGMKEEEAIGLITHRNAKILGIDDKLGTIEKGKLASVVVWNKNPLHLGAKTTLVVAEGKIIRR